MVTIDINGREFDLPQSWAEVTLDKFNKIVKHSSLLNDYKSKTQFSLELFAILLGAEYDDVKQLTTASYAKLSEECEWVNKAIEPTNCDSFTINGELFVPITNYNQLTMGEAIDFEIIIADSPKEDILVNILPILVRKAKAAKRADGVTILAPAEFEADDYEANKELFKNNLMVADVINFQNFFLSGESQYSTTTKDTSEK